jgi:protein PhnA
MWNPTPAVQVMTYQLLGKLSGEDWVAGLRDQMYMADEETEEWAAFTSNSLVHKDSNGNILTSGDTVTLIQDLNVKGAGFTAKRGTSVRRIRLVHDNEEHIEGKIDGQQIVILTKYVKKTT